MNDTRKVFGEFDPGAPRVSGIAMGLLRTAEHISENLTLPIETVSGILNDPEHAPYIDVIPRLDDSPLYKLKYNKMLMINILPNN